MAQELTGIQTPAHRSTTFYSRLSCVAASPPLSGCLTGDTLTDMAEVTVRELRNGGGRVLDRVERGESVTVTRDGRAVAELRPLSRRPLRASALLSRWRRLTHVDAARLKADIDATLDASL